MTASTAPNHARFLRFALLAAVLAGGAAARPLSAALLVTNSYTLAESAAAERDVWVLTDQADIRGTARYDVFAAAVRGGTQGAGTNAGRVEVSGRIEGDLWAAGMAVSIPGSVAHHARLAGRTVSVSGRIGSGLDVVAGSLILETNAVVEGPASLGGNHLILRGAVEGPLAARASTVTLDGRFGSDVEVDAQTLIVAPGTVIGGALRYRTPAEFVADRGVEIRGGIVRLPPLPAPPRVAFLPHTAMFLGSLLAGMLLLALLPGPAARTGALARGAPLRALALGALALLGLPVLALVMFLTVVGIPLACLLAAAWLLLGCLARFAAACMLGGLLDRRPPGPSPLGQRVSQLAFGLFILYLSAWLPGLLATAFWCWFTCLGAGAIVLALRRPALPPVPAPPRRGTDI